MALKEYSNDFIKNEGTQLRNQMPHFEGGMSPINELSQRTSFYQNTAGANGQGF